ncbi:MAG: GNAT family N-acetyltransferase [Rhodospirillaceae bacterium]|jgi:[ribosomal protein S5]-alanine N-acetyltransferase|nr:GNAT family N-acetyltransferase [Rhodospirillaceae bacterium]MBT6203401.1 GNAT family N-acetyltransferase [Rhodospirillaceae bacterium]MBT6508825.1 GNAT family N-acetyltransferase [Rhodospirillaceae bacterium]MBT7611634.1 GNAT family N-acetyltransferase [Rhodospirillaceae bacterium]
MLPMLTTKRLNLRPAVMDDAEALWRLWTHQDVRRFLFDDETLTYEKTQEQVEVWAGHHANGMGLWMLERKDNGGLIGEIGIEPSTMGDVDPGMKGEIEFQIAIAPDAWGKSYAGEALQAVLDHAFNTVGLSHIMGVADVPNTRSRRLQESLGFVLQREVPSSPLPLAIYKREAG